MDPATDPGMTPGQRIKIWRKRRGLTQEAAAGLKGCSVSGWRKWEAGERQVNSLSDWIEIARILRVRDLYKLTGMPIGQLPDDPGEHETVPPIRAALHSYAPRMEGEPDLTRLHDAIVFAWDSWHGSGNRYTRTGPMLPDLITEVRAVLHTADGDQRRDAHRLACELYLLVRPFVKRIGATDVAIVAADRAMAAAEAADDPLYRAAAAWNLAVVLSTNGYCEEAAELCQSAMPELRMIDDQDSRRLALLGHLHMLYGIQQARLNDERRALDALDVAHELSGITGETNHYRLVFGPTNIKIHRAAVALELSRPAEARRIAERIDVTPLPSVERRHTHYLDLARVYAAQREDLGAVHMLVRADRECPEESSFNLPFRATVRELLSRETATTRPELRPLAERIGIA